LQHVENNGKNYLPQCEPITKNKKTSARTHIQLLKKKCQMSVSRYIRKLDFSNYGLHFKEDAIASHAILNNLWGFFSRAC
jgi:hypothetical protein